MRTGLILEGGAMRGMYTAGVTDVFLDNNLVFDGAIGVSAGAVFGCNYKSRQSGRVIRYNKKYCRDPRYVSMRSLLRTGDIYGADFCYNELPNKLDIFDVETYRANPMEFYVTCTDVTTGEAVYHRCDRGDAVDLKWMRASASMPVLSNIIEIDGRLLSDGGTADSVPVRYFQSLGYDRNVVILTQPHGYVKRLSKLQPLIRHALRKYPALIKALETRPERYNENITYIEKEAEQGRLLLIRPQQALKIGAVERDPRELDRVYAIGKADGLRYLDQVKNFLAASR